MFLLNVLLAFAWVALRGSATTLDFAVGFAFGFAVLSFASRLLGAPGYGHRVARALGFAAFFAWELLLANLRVVYEVLTPTHHMRPGIVAVPLDLETDAQVLLLSSLLSLTPGSLVVDVSPDRRTLWVHAMYVDDADAFRSRVKSGFERRVKELWS